MNIEEIRKAAPSGATHYVDAEVEIIFLRMFSGGWQCYVFGNWHSFDAADSEIKPLYLGASFLQSSKACIVACHP